MKKTEIRNFDLAECRMVKDGEKRTMVGRPVVYNSESRLMGDFREIILPGAFDKTINDASADVYVLNQHRTDMPIARRAKGTLRINQDDTGINIEFDLGNQSYAKDLEENVASGNVEKMSFGFITEKAEWHRPTEDRPYYLREIHEAKLIEVSPVTFPAYEETSLATRSFEEFRKQSEENKPVTRSREKLRMRSKILNMRKK